MKVAILGRTTNMVDPDSQLKLSKDDTIIIDEEDLFVIDETEKAVSPYIKKWAEKNKYSIIEMGFKSYLYKGDYENDYWKSHIAWYKHIVQNADMIIIYCDEEDYSYRELNIFAAGYALFLDKPVEIIKLKPMQHFTFSIGYEDEKHAECFFSVKVDKDIPKEKARGIAIEQAKKKFSDYTEQHPIHFGGYGHGCELCILEEGRYWKTVE